MTDDEKRKFVYSHRLVAVEAEKVFGNKWFSLGEYCKKFKGDQIGTSLLFKNVMGSRYMVSIMKGKKPMYKIVLDDNERKWLIKDHIRQKEFKFHAEINFLEELIKISINDSPVTNSTEANTL